MRYAATTSDGVGPGESQAFFSVVNDNGTPYWVILGRPRVERGSEIQKYIELSFYTISDFYVILRVTLLSSNLQRLQSQKNT